ncbi:hypothetical protein ACWEV4_06750 [Streptomyces sp. NPDC003860]
MSNTPARRAAVAASAVSLSLLLAACGSEGGDDKKDAKGDAKGSSSAAAPAAKALTQAELEKLALTQADLKDAAIETPTAKELAEMKGATSDKPECTPLATSFAEGKPGPATASAMRMIVTQPKTDGRTPSKDAPLEEQLAALEKAAENLQNMSPTMSTLSSYEGNGAVEALARLKKAGADCAAGFTATAGGEKTSFTKVTPATYSGGDEAVAYTVTQDVDGDPTEFQLVAIRKGSTIANFLAMTASGKSEQPKTIIDTQMKKLG